MFLTESSLSMNKEEKLQFTAVSTECGGQGRAKADGVALIEAQL